MKRDDIIRIARSARASFETADNMFMFVSLIAAAEREACAKQLDAIARKCREENSDHEPFKYAAAAIRARGES